MSNETAFRIILVLGGVFIGIILTIVISFWVTSGIGESSEQAYERGYIEGERHIYTIWLGKGYIPTDSNDIDDIWYSDTSWVKPDDPTDTVSAVEVNWDTIPFSEIIDDCTLLLWVYYDSAGILFLSSCPPDSFGIDTIPVVEPSSTLDSIGGSLMVRTIYSIPPADDSVGESFPNKWKRGDTKRDSLAAISDTVTDTTHSVTAITYRESTGDAWLIHFGEYQIESTNIDRIDTVLVPFVDSVMYDWEGQYAWMKMDDSTLGRFYIVGDEKGNIEGFYREQVHLKKRGVRIESLEE